MCVMAEACNPSIRESDAGSLQVQVQPRLLSAFETSLNYRETLYQKMGGGVMGHWFGG